MIGTFTLKKLIIWRDALAMTCHILASNTHEDFRYDTLSSSSGPPLFHCEREHGADHSCSPIQADMEKLSKNDWKTKQTGTLVCLPPTMTGKLIFIWFLGTTHYSINHVKGILVKTTKMPNYMSEHWLTTQSITLKGIWVKTTKIPNYMSEHWLKKS